MQQEGRTDSTEKSIGERYGGTLEPRSDPKFSEVREARDLARRAVDVSNYRPLRPHPNPHPS